MLLGHLLTDAAQIFADERTCWSPSAVKHVTGRTLIGAAAPGLLHLTNSGAAALDGCGAQLKNGQPAMKPFWDITSNEAQACRDAASWPPAMTGYFQGGGFS